MAVIYLTLRFDKNCHIGFLASINRTIGVVPNVNVFRIIGAPVTREVDERGRRRHLAVF